MLATLTSADFFPLRDQLFRLQHTYSTDHIPSAPQIDLRLDEVADLGTPGADAPRRQPFSLIFQATCRGYLPQRMYTLEHDALGQLEIFLVPIGVTDEGTRYQAIFN